MTMRSRHLTLVVVAILAVMVVTAALVVGGSSRRQTATSPTPVVRQHHPKPSLPRLTHGASSRASKTQKWVRQPQPPVQAVSPTVEAMYGRIAAATPVALNDWAAAGYPPPAPLYSGGWTAMPTRPVTPAAYASAYASQLLSIDFAHQTRTGLFHWLAANQASLDLPGYGRAGAQGILFAYANGGPSFIVPGAKENPHQNSPIPTTPQWASLARAGVSWHVTNVFASTRPQWSTIIAEGFIPPNPDTTDESVSGTLTVVQPGHASTTSHWTMYVGVGSGIWLGGLGVSTFTTYLAGAS